MQVLCVRRRPLVEFPDDEERIGPDALTQDGRPARADGRAFGPSVAAGRARPAGTGTRSVARPTSGCPARAIDGQARARSASAAPGTGAQSASPARRESGTDTSAARFPQATARPQKCTRATPTRRAADASGSPASRRRVWAPRKKAVGHALRSRAKVASGVARSAINTVVAPTESGKLEALPSP